MSGQYLNSFNGTVLIAQHGKTIYQKAFGYRNYQLKQLLNNSSIFELASISKQFTAMGILLLKEEGKLKLTDSLRKYLPELSYHHITIYNLLTHTSGLPDYLKEMDKLWNHKKIAFNEDVIDFLVDKKPAPHFDPGSQYEYSNTGYVLLAAVIEKISGQTYNEFLKTNIFIPLSMNNTRVYNTLRSRQDTIKDYAFGYVYQDATGDYVLPDKKYDIVHWLDGVTGDGKISSTAPDLLKWNNALLNHLLISKSNQTDMLSPHVLADTTTKIHYGYGVELGKDELGNFISHDGYWPGYSTILTHYTTGDYTIIVLSNNQHNASGISKALAYILNGRPIVLPYQHHEVAIDTATLKMYTGTYLMPLKIEIVERGGKLYRHIAGKNSNSDVELKPESLTKFFYSNKLDIQIEFQINKGKVIKTFIVNSGIKTEIEKIR